MAHLIACQWDINGFTRCYSAAIGRLAMSATVFDGCRWTLAAFDAISVGAPWFVMVFDGA